MMAENALVKCAVIGDPVAHSLSPMIHNQWFKTYNISGIYEAITVKRGALKPAIDDMITGGYRGFNVTIPHKESMIELCDTLDNAAKKIGAVNMVCIKDGALNGCNTDAAGFAMHFKKTIKCPNQDFRTNKALVLGAGGAARAIVYALGQMGYKDIIVANRTFERARDVTEVLGGTPIKWSSIEAHIKDADAVINTTSLGMDGQPPLEIDLSPAPAGCVVSDIVYKPLETGLLKSARAQGLLCIDGLGMLLHQAVPAFEAWTGKKPEAGEALRKMIEDTLA